MSNTVITTTEVPQSRDYSQAVRAGNTIYVAGTTGVDVTTGQMAGSTAEAQTRQAMRNVQAVLRAAGADLVDTVMIHTLLAHTEDAATVTEVLEEFYPVVRPPRCVSRIGVERADLLVSISLVAVVS